VQRGWALGIYGSVGGLAALTGPVVGGVVTQGLAWPWIFWLNVPIGLVAIVLMLRRIEESVGPRTALDIGGLTLVTGAALGVMWGLVRGNSAGWDSGEVVAPLAAGVLLALAFVAWERRTPAPMLPLRLFGARAFSAGNAAIFLLSASLTGTLFFLAQYFQTAQGQSPLDAGLRLLALNIVPFVVAPITGALINRVGARRLIVGGFLLEAIAMAWIALIATPALAYAALVAPLIIAGCGFSLAIPATAAVVVSAVAPAEIGKASGTYSMVRQLGAAFGVALIAAVFARAGSFASPQAFVDGFTPALGVAAALALLGALVGVGIPARRTATAGAEAAPAQTTPAAQAGGMGTGRS